MFDCKWAPNGLSFATTDSHGFVRMFGLGSNDKFKIVSYSDNLYIALNISITVPSHPISKLSVFEILHILVARRVLFPHGLQAINSGPEWLRVR